MQRTLGINGLGRIGKLALWYHLGRDDFDRFVVNQGRVVGTSLESVAQYLSKDSTYGPLHRYLYGHRAKRDVQVVDEAAGLMRIHGKELQFLREARNPKDIPWAQYGAYLVIDSTGKFTDPGAAPDDSGSGSIRGHLEGGAKLVVQSSPFKSKTKDLDEIEDAMMVVYGINHTKYDPNKHTLLSGASCTTTALAHMLKPLMENDLTKNIITAAMSTIHAVTNSQLLLDAVPKTGAKDLRRSRSALDNIIITSTNAAKALRYVMPEIGEVGFMADSIRIPTSAVSLIILNLTIQTGAMIEGCRTISNNDINAIYREWAQSQGEALLQYSEEQNVSKDMLGEDAAVVIEAIETDSRMGFMNILVPADGKNAETIEDAVLSTGMCGFPDVPKEYRTLQVPVAHVKVFGWYDNEMGSYSHRLGELTSYAARLL